MKSRICRTIIIALGLGAASLSGAKAKADQTPIGYFDTATQSGYVNGWSYDPDFPSQSNYVDVYIDGPWYAAKYGVRVYANDPRPDVDTVMKVTGNHGFHMQVPSKFLDGKYHTIYAYGIDLNGTMNSLLMKGTHAVVLGTTPVAAPISTSACIQIYPRNAAAIKFNATSRMLHVKYSTSSCAWTGSTTFYVDGVQSKTTHLYFGTSTAFVPNLTAGTHTLTVKFKNNSGTIVQNSSTVTVK